MQDSPPHWVAVHRRHHQFAGEAQDPHSPLKSFFWAHMGWLLVKEDMTRRLIEARQGHPARPALRLDRKAQQLAVDCAAGVAGLFAAGFAFVLLAGGGGAGVRFGLSLAIWGGALRTVFVWHTTWSSIL